MKTIDKNSFYWKLSEKIISLNTVSHQENIACASVLADELKSLGFKVVLDQYQDALNKNKSQIIAKIGPDVEGGIILSGHIDTVPFADQPGWTREALKLQEDDGKIFGRGTCDMKLFLSCCIESFKQMDLSKLQKPIICLFTADEEVGCQGAKRMVDLVEKLLESTPLPTRAIIGEPSSFQMINRHKGVGHFELTLNGKAWHSSRPDLGINSIEPVKKVINLLQDLNANFEKEKETIMNDEFPDFAKNYLHLATINGGFALNMVPEKTKLGFSFRSFPHQSPSYVYDQFKNVLQEEMKDVDFHLGHLMDTPAMPMSNDKQLEECISSVCGEHGTRSVSFATDGGYFSKLGINCYIWGPGGIEMAHRPDEYMPVQDFLNGPIYLRRILEELVL